MATLRPTTRLRAVSAPPVAILAVIRSGTFRRRDVLESIVEYTGRNAAPGLWPEAAFEGRARYLLIL
jgi:hypothetical protein